MCSSDLGFALVSSIVTFIISALLLPQFDFSNADKLQLGNKISWIKSINANYEIGIDGISLPLLILSTFITVLAIIYSIEHLPEPKSPKGFLALILVLETGMNGTFVADDIAFERACSVPPKGIGAQTMDKVKNYGRDEGLCYVVLARGFEV